MKRWIVTREARHPIYAETQEDAERIAHEEINCDYGDDCTCCVHPAGPHREFDPCHRAWKEGYADALRLCLRLLNAEAPNARELIEELLEGGK